MEACAVISGSVTRDGIRTVSASQYKLDRLVLMTGVIRRLTNVLLAAGISFLVVEYQLPVA